MASTISCCKTFRVLIGLQRMRQREMARNNQGGEVPQHPISWDEDGD